MNEAGLGYCNKGEIKFSLSYLQSFHTNTHTVKYTAFYTLNINNVLSFPMSMKHEDRSGNSSYYQGFYKNRNIMCHIPWS